MANLISSAYSDNEAGSTSWTLASGSATLSNSTDFANTGVQSFKGVAGAASMFKISSAYADRFACSASTVYDFKTFFRATSAQWIDWGVDWYTGAGSYISTSTFSGANASTSGFVQFTDLARTSPGTAGAFALWFQYNPSASGQIIYMDTYTVDVPGSANKGIPPGFF